MEASQPIRGSADLRKGHDTGRLTGCQRMSLTSSARYGRGPTSIGLEACGGGVAGDPSFLTGAAGFGLFPLAMG